MAKARERLAKKKAKANGEAEFKRIIAEGELLGGQKQVLSLWIREAEAEMAKLEVQGQISEIKKESEVARLAPRNEMERNLRELHDRCEEGARHYEEHLAGLAEPLSSQARDSEYGSQGSRCSRGIASKASSRLFDRGAAPTARSQDALLHQPSAPAERGSQLGRGSPQSASSARNRRYRKATDAVSQPNSSPRVAEDALAQGGRQYPGVKERGSARGDGRHRRRQERQDEIEDPEGPCCREELVELANPEVALKAIQGDLKSNDWEAQQRGVTAMRRVMYHHADAASHSIKLMFRDVLPLAESLRSGVSRSALLTAAEAMETFKGTLVEELSVALSVLVRRIIDVNKFISKEADGALASLAMHMPPARCIAVLLPLMTHKSAVVRSKIARGLVTCLKRVGGKPSKVKNPAELVRILLAGLDDSNHEVRTYARDALLVMEAVAPDEVIKFCERAQPGKGQKRLKLIL